ncbi:hypothetical protein EOD41_15500 [Mucilaginibacter limnophilus]|uniref:Uncharacterized protein n=1 Tax=Mucilaginibacter limnophilus TaxID=1932778 RepID=A0A3S2Y1V8_9SPHI|nr:hypothetical protein [Mucilaginibacter limnophilus]RVT99844.1 hypothetical protein EOD41_15500 [Mucilaginibacter limnophilus]
MQQAYINSGILETYVLGCASEKEAEEVLYMAEQYPEIMDALRQLEDDMEVIAANMAINPPPHVWPKVERKIEDLIRHRPLEPALYRETTESYRKAHTDGSHIIAIEGESTHMRVHKVWRWVFLGVFILGKIFLAFAIYYFVQSMRSEREIEKLQNQIEQLKR